MWRVVIVLTVAVVAAQRLSCDDHPQCNYEGAPTGDHIYKIGEARLLVSWKDGEYLMVQCEGAVLDAPGLPRFKTQLSVLRVVFRQCSAARAGWGATLRVLGVAPPFRLDLVALPDKALSREHFIDLPGLRDLRLFGVDNATRPTVAADALRDLPELVSLRCTDVRVQLAELPVWLQNVSVSGAGAVRAGWGSLRPKLGYLRLIDVEDATGVAGAENLRVLQLEGAPARALWRAALPQLEHATLMKVLEAPAGLWTNSTRLRAVSLVWSRAVRSLPRRWLAGHTLLESLSLQQLSLSTLPADLLRGATALLTLVVQDCGVTSLPDDLLRDAAGLKDINLDNNRLTVISPSLLARAVRLQSVSVRHNALTSLGWVPTPRASLSVLHASHNPLGDTCARGTSNYDTIGNSPLRELTGLRTLSLSSTGLTQICADWRLSLVRLDRLDLQHNNITDLYVSDLSWSRRAGSGVAHVDLTHNPLRDLHYSYTEYNETRAAVLPDTDSDGEYRDTVLDLGGSALRCDCVVYYAVQALPRLTQRVVLRDATCADGRPLTALVPEELECALEGDECPPSCSCSVRAASRHVTRAACSALSAPLLRWSAPLHLTLQHAALRRVPRLAAPPQALRLANNTIDTLALSDVTAGLQELDLRNNSLTSLEEGVTSALLAAPPRGPRLLRLSHNPWRCDCDAAPLLDALQEHADRVADYASLQCADGGAVRAVSSAALCASRRWARGAAVTLAVLLAVGCAAGLLLVRYRHLVKAFLHTHGPACCRTEPDDSEERRWDVFVSYSHEDAEWTEGVLVPRLEATGHRACVHVRDWVAGDWIPAQIARSVRSSRRTLAVLSPAYLRSVWARAELRAALALSVQSARPRLVLLLLQDVDATLLREEPDLQAYLALNTYLRADDPAFWDKLTVALPRRLRGAKRAELTRLTVEPDVQT